MQSGPGGSLRCCSSSEYISASPASGGSVTHSCEERGTDSADEASGGTPARRLLARRRQGGPGAGVFVQGWAGVGGGAAGSWEPPPRLGEAVSVGCVQTQPVRGSVVRGAGGRRGGCRARGRGPAAPSRPQPPPGARVGTQPPRDDKEGTVGLRETEPAPSAPERRLCFLIAPALGRLARPWRRWERVWEWRDLCSGI